MFCRAQRAAIAALLLLIPTAGHAQVVWQPTTAPLVTAENTTWFPAGEPVEWNGDLFYPGGAVQSFNRYQMVRSGSFRGIPLYTDTMLEPNSIVFVPLSGGRMQPYERLRAGVLAGTTGSRTPSYPPESGAQGTPPAGLSQASAGPAQAPAYDIGAPAAEPAMARPPVLLVSDTSPRAVSQPTAVGTSGRSASARRETSLRPPTGLNTIWINYDGRRWVSAGKAIGYDATSLTQVGTYRGWSVYTRHGDPSIIYIPGTPGRLSAYRQR